MRILLTFDLHYKLRQYDWLIKVAPSFDAVVIAGDHIDIASSVPPDVQIAALSASFAATSRKTHLLPGLARRHAPTAVLCGHIHEAPFKTGGSWVDRIGSTLLFNAGQQIGETPACVEIDFAKGFARWNSLAGDETRALNPEPAQ